MNAECNSDDCVSTDLLQDKTETQSEPPTEITDPREQDEHGMTDAKMSPIDSVKVCDNYITLYHNYIGHCQFPETYT
jgi:hypothetical protein